MGYTNCEPFSARKAETNGCFKEGNSTKFETESIKSSLWDYFDAFILVAADITVSGDNNRDVTFTNCPLFSTSEAEVNDFFETKQFS